MKYDGMTNESNEYYTIINEPCADDIQYNEDNRKAPWGTIISEIQVITSWLHNGKVGLRPYILMVATKVRFHTYWQKKIRGPIL